MTVLAEIDSGNGTITRFAYRISATADSTATFRSTLSSSPYNRHIIHVYQFRPDSGDTVTYDAGPGGAGSTWSAAPQSGNITTTESDEVAVGAIGNAQARSTSSFQIADGTVDGSISGTGLHSGYRIFSSTQSNIHAQGTLSGDASWSAGIVAFASAGAPGTPTIYLRDPGAKFNISLSSGGTPSITGTSSGTQAVQTGTGSGTVTAPAAVTGTSSGTQAVQTGTGNGSQSYTATSSGQQAIQTGTGSGTVVSGGITGTSSGSQAVQTGTGSGTVTAPASVTGTSSGTQAIQTGTGSGTVGVPAVTGTASGSQAIQTGTASGSQSYTSTSSGSQALQTGTASGTQTYTATASGSQAVQTGTGSGSVSIPAITGTSSGSQAAQTGTSTGSQSYTASSSGAQARQTGTGTGIAAVPTVPIDAYIAYVPGESREVSALNESRVLTISESRIAYATKSDDIAIILNESRAVAAGV
jgi:trimeric autotransporter adhesin